jgi:hypothetical protein
VSVRGNKGGKKDNALVALCLELVIRSSSFQQWLVDSSTTSDNPNRSSSIARDRLLRTTRQSDTSLVLLGGMSDDGSIVPRRPSECSTITDLLLDIADDGSFGHIGEREDISDGESGFLSAIYKGSSVQTFCCDEGL